PRAPLEVAGLAPADWHHAETLRELFLPFRAAVARGRLCRRIHLEDPLIQRRENPDGLSRALRPGVAVGEELLSLVGFRARSTRSVSVHEIVRTVTRIAVVLARLSPGGRATVPLRTSRVA